MKFLHTSDLQLGKPFGSVEQEGNRELLRSTRINCIQTLGRIAQENSCSAILIAGDLFDSTSPDDKTVARAMSAIRSIPLPFYVITGNHDNAGTGNFWEQEFFTTELAQTPNFHLLAARETPLSLPDAILLPCPLFRQQDIRSPTQWLENPDLIDSLPNDDRPRIVLAHGSTQGFDSETDSDDEDGSTTSSSTIDIDALNTSLHPDYIALGDWHGQKQIAPNAWYSGTPEPDRFPKNEAYQNGLALIVDIPARGAPPTITPIQTGATPWKNLSFHLTDEDSLHAFETDTGALSSGCLQLTLTGNLSFSLRQKLDTLLKHLTSLHLRIKLSDSIQLRPSPDEINRLIHNNANPLTQNVATHLYELSQSPDPTQADTATEALHILFGLASSLPESL